MVSYYAIGKMLPQLYLLHKYNEGDIDKEELLLLSAALWADRPLQGATGFAITRIPLAGVAAVGAAYYASHPEEAWEEIERYYPLQHKYMDDPLEFTESTSPIIVGNALVTEAIKMKKAIPGLVKRFFKPTKYWGIG